MAQSAGAELNVDNCVDSDSDAEIPQAKHAALLEAVSQLDGKPRVTAATRSEPSLHLSEFHLVGSRSGVRGKVRVADLAKVLGKRSSHVEIGRKVQVVQKKLKTLPKPVEKNVSEKVRRSIGFENLATEFGKWDAVVHSNRSVDILSFPLNQSEDRLMSSNAFVAKLKSQKPTELEAKIAEILVDSRSLQEENMQEEENEYSLTTEELLEHRKEMAKMRALESYKAAKAARQKRIKSKKYHRLQRREAVRKRIKNFELLQRTDPEAAMKQLEELERARAEERMSLRHRSTGHWAHSKEVRAKYDNEARRVLAEQLAISRELTQKVGQEADSGVDSDTGGAETEMLEVDPSGTGVANPWMMTQASEVKHFVNGYRKYWEEQNKRKTETELAEKNSRASKERDENVDSSSSSKRIKLMESVVEKVELLESNPDVKRPCRASVDNQEPHENCTDTLPVGLSSAKNSNKVRRNKLTYGDETVMEKTNKKMDEDEKHEQTCQHEILNAKEKKQKSGAMKRERCKQTVCATGFHSITSTSSTWVVTDVSKSEEKTQTEGSKKKNKMKLKKSSSASSFDVTETKTGSMLEVDADVKLDDLFDEAEEKLKQKIKQKVITLQSGLERVKHEKEKTHDLENKVEVDGRSLEMKKVVARPAVDEELGEVPHDGSDRLNDVESDLDELARVSRAGRNAAGEREGAVPSAVSIDPHHFLQVKQKYLMSQIPHVVTKGDEAMDDDDDDDDDQEMAGEDGEVEQEKLIAEAFADDDVVAEFRNEKEESIEKSKVKDIDMSLPGWGDWGGPNMEVSRRKKRRFIFTVPKDTPRRDDNKGNLIINEDKDTKIKEHQVSELPFPFERLQDFEASIRAPVGRDWLPETAHRKITAPSVLTKLGTVIQPMDEDMLFRKKKKRGRKTFYPI